MKPPLEERLDPGRIAVMSFEEIDPADDEAFGAWFAVSDACHQHNWPGEPGWQLEELRATWSGFDGSLKSIGLLARDLAGVAIGSAMVRLPQQENLRLAEVSIEVHPAHRRGGAGTALLVESEHRAATDGRDVIIANEDAPAWRGTGAPGKAFAVHHGYSCALVNDRRDLALPVDAAHLLSLEVSALPFASGYHLASFRGRYPDKYRRGRVALARTMSTAAPQGDTEREEEIWDDERLRRFEETLAEQNRTLLCTCAIEETTGNMVAFTELAIPLGVPEVAYQYDTLVVSEHRGHRLGTLAKIANLRELERTSPATRRVLTWNAQDNAAMVSINEALGFGFRGHSRVWQRRLRV
jgi:GNAT superfamily N-acetyltransferase